MSEKKGIKTLGFNLGRLCYRTYAICRTNQIKMYPEEKHRQKNQMLS
jgi:hypothetical protein